MGVYQYTAGGLTGFFNQIAGTKYGTPGGRGGPFSAPAKAPWLGGTFKGGGGILGMWDRLSNYMGIGYENPWQTSAGVQALSAMKGQSKYYRTMAGGSEMFRAAPFLRRSLRVTEGGTLAGVSPMLKKQSEFAAHMESTFGRRRWGVGAGAAAAAIGIGATVGYGNLFQMGIGAGVGAVGGAALFGVGASAVRETPLLGRLMNRSRGRAISGAGAKMGAAFGAAGMGVGMLTGYL